MTVFDLAALDAARLQRDPFDFLVVPGFLSSAVLEDVNRDYPVIEDPGNYAPENLSYGAAFQRVLDGLADPQFLRRMSDKFDVDLMDSASTITIRKYCEQSDGNIHTDHWSKIVTMLIYFNPEWSNESGQLRMLRSPSDIEDYAAEVTPLGGTLLAFRRTDNSFHGHRRFVGERRMLQLSWIRPNRTAQYTQKLARLSTHTVKRLLRLGGNSPT